MPAAIRKATGVYIRAWKSEVAAVTSASINICKRNFNTVFHIPQICSSHPLLQLSMRSPPANSPSYMPPTVFLPVPELEHEPHRKACK